MRQCLRALARPLVRPIKKYFIRCRFMASIRPSDVFVVTYPKSATRWIGFFLAYILSKRIPGPTKPLTVTDYGGYVSDINNKYFRSIPLEAYRQLPDPRVFTVHAPWDPKLPKVVYLVRDPRAVLVSYYHHHRIDDPQFDLSLREFIVKNEMWPCDWGEHVRGWLAHRGEEQVLFVRYEDLHRDSLCWFKKILEFCNLFVSEEELISAIENSRFDKMRRVEEETNMHRSYVDPNTRLMRKGKIDSWRKELNDELVRIIEDRYGELMDSLGYPCT